MSTINRKTISMFVVAASVLLGAMMMANPISLANAQGNETNVTTATGATKAITITKIEVDPILEALQKAYPKVEFGEDDKKFVESLKDIKDAKELARLMVAEQLIHDLNALKALQE